MRDSGTGEIDFTDRYADSTHCQWVVSCPPGTEVAITVDDLDVESGYDYLDILAGVDLAGTGAPVAHLTGSTLPNPATFTSSGQASATLSFTSDASVASRGFHLTYACSVSSGATTGQCTPVTVGARPREGNIDTSGGNSITYCLTATGGTTYQISVDLETLADSTLALFAPDGATQLAENDDFGSGLSSYLEWTAPADGTYHIVVAGYGTETGTFILSVVDAAGGNDPCNGGSTMHQSTGTIFFSNAYETGATCDWTVTCTNVRLEAIPILYCRFFRISIHYSSFLMHNSSFLIQNSSFSIHNSSFLMQHSTRNPHHNVIPVTDFCLALTTGLPDPHLPGV